MRLIAAAPRAMKMPRKKQGEQDTDQQHRLLRGSGHAKPGHDEDEDEQVVHGSGSTR